MTVTVSNYNSAASKIDFSKMPEPIQKSHSKMPQLIKAYDKSEGIKKMVDIYLDKLNKALLKEQPKKQPKEKKPIVTDARKEEHEEELAQALLKVVKDNGLDSDKRYSGIVSDFLNAEYDRTVSDLVSGKAQVKTVEVLYNAMKDMGMKPVKRLDEALKVAKAKKKPATKTKEVVKRGRSVVGYLTNEGDKGWAYHIGKPSDKEVSTFTGKKPLTKAEAKKRLLEATAPPAPKKKPAAKKKATPKKKGAASTKKKSGSKSTKTKTPAIRNKDLVRTFDDEIRIIKRFAGLIGRNKTVKSWVLFHRYLQKKLAEKAVHGNSKLAPEVDKIAGITSKVVADSKGISQKEVLVKAPETLAKKATRLAKGTAVYPSVSLMKRYINMQGEVPEQSKLNKLITSIQNAIKKKRVHRDDPFGKELEEALKSLKHIRKTGKVEPTQIGLSGADGLAGLAEYFGLGK